MSYSSEYQVTQELFETRYSYLYRCQHKQDSSSVILKALKNRFPTHEEIAFFRREYNIIQSLTAEIEEVIRPLRLEEYGNNVIMVMEDPGGDLLPHLRSRLDLRAFLQIAVRMVEILGKIHQRKIIHKDIKTSNILWNPENGSLKIIDFSISTKLLNERPELQNARFMEGTLGYISPEQTGRMNRSIDYRTDYYSLGVTLYELLTGFLPFRSEDAMELVHAHMAKAPCPPHQIMEEIPIAPNSIHDIPPVISDIIIKLMHKAPEHRYQSIYGLKSDLQRCLELLESKGKIIEFEIGTQDISDYFQVPQKLYGREKEVETLMQVFEEVSEGATEVMLVSGYSGVGKSALVNEIHKPIVRQKGYFIHGKFEKFQHTDPYSAIIHSFRQLVYQLLQEPDLRLQFWRERLKEALGANGQIIVNIIPELEKIIGAQPALQELNPTESRNRFLFTFENFVKIFACAEHPLTIFLDDLQWSDPASLQLLEYLIGCQDLRYFFLIGAYRDNEVHCGHPLVLSINEIEKNKAVHRLFIRTLSEANVNKIVADTLHCNYEDSQDLGGLIYRKTGGNPFFVTELLKTLFQDGRINFNQEQGKWDWDVERILQIQVSDDVVEFISERLKELPEETQNSLKLAACIGHFFDFKTLALIEARSPEKTAEALWTAMEKGIIIPLNNNYRLLHAWTSRTGETFPDFEVNYQFQHDRVQQAAYAMIKEERRKAVHLQIGRLMLDTKGQNERVIDIVRHLNQAIELIQDINEKGKLIELNLAAGKKAKASNAHSPALQYFKTAYALLSKNAWQENYSLIFEILKLYSECAYLCGEFDEAEKNCEILLHRAKTKQEKAEIKEMQSAHYTFLGKMDSAIQAGIAGLRYLGIKLPERPHAFAILIEITIIKWKLKYRLTEELLERPIIHEPEIKLAMRLLFGFIPPAFISGRYELFALAVLKKTNISLKYGNCPESAAAYIGYAILLAAMGNLQGAYDFGNLALRLNERFDDPRWKSLTFVLYTLFCHGWKEPRHTFPHWFKKAIEAGLQTGDLLYMAHACFYINLWNPYINIPTAIEEGQKYIALIEQTKYKEALATTQLAQQRWLCLAGRTAEPVSFNDAGFNENDYLSHLKKAKYFSGIAIYYIYKMQICYLHEDYQTAVQCIYATDKIIKTLLGSAFMEEFCLHAFLTIAALLPEQKFYDKKKAWRRLQREYKRMRHWAMSCPVNYLSQKILMQAEIARLSGKHAQAVKLYGEAIEAAEKNDYTYYKALCNELAARFYQEQGAPRVAIFYLRDAIYYYNSWGAVAKGTQLEQKYFSLLTNGVTSTSNISTTSTHMQIALPSESREMLDLSTIIKVSQTISREIHLNGLLEKIMNIVIENAGAQQGFLLLNSDSGWIIAAEGSVEKKNSLLPLCVSVEHSGRIAKSIFHYTLRTGHNVVINDASQEEQYAGDPYIVENCPKSILCYPILSQGKIVGIWYLENNLIQGAFTAERLKILKLLSGQIAISLENAQIYQKLEELNKNLEQKVQERTQQLKNKNRQLMDSIRYARNIQASILPKPARMGAYLSQYFIIWKPQTLVGGDFYWFKPCAKNCLMALGDCTGHGVPGALMTMLASTILSRVAESTMCDNPAQILRELNILVRNSLNQNQKNTLSDDGLDIGICCIMRPEKKLIFAGAKINLYHFSIGNLETIPGDRQSIGYKRSRENFEYKNQTINPGPDSIFYLTTDGYLGQNGENDSRNFGRKRFEELLLCNSGRTLTEQKNLLEKAFQNYKGRKPQRDDVTVLGFKF